MLEQVQCLRSLRIDARYPKLRGGKELGCSADVNARDRLAIRTDNLAGHGFAGIDLDVLDQQRRLLERLDLYQCVVPAGVAGGRKRGESAPIQAGDRVSPDCY